MHKLISLGWENPFIGFDSHSLHPFSTSITKTLSFGKWGTSGYAFTESANLLIETRKRTKKKVVKTFLEQIRKIIQSKEKKKVSLIRNPNMDSIKLIKRRKKFFINKQTCVKIIKKLSMK